MQVFKIEDKLEKKYQHAIKTSRDIKQHLPVLREYAEKCDHITEFGVRGIVSTWAFLVARPNKLISYDIEHPRVFGGNILEVYECAVAAGVKFTFIQKNVLEVEIKKTDLLFLDTLHRFDQLLKELELHADKVKKYIIMHDTKTFKERGEDGNHYPTLEHQGLDRAISIFLMDNSDWEVEAIYNNENGLTILKRRQ